MLQRADECLEYQVDGEGGYIGDTSTYVPLGQVPTDAALPDAEQCVAWRRGLWDLPEDCFMR